MKICSECEARNADHSYLCVQCGARLSATSEDTTDGYTGDTDEIAPVEALTPENLVERASDALTEGQAQQAVEICERALALDPNYLPAFSLLGMAHEEAGNLECALSAYEQVLRIDPSRAADRQKVNLLKLRILRGDQPEEQPESEQAKLAHPWLKHAPIALAVAAALFVFVIGAIIVVSARNATRTAAIEEEFQNSINAGNQAMADNRFARAEAYYEQALALKPDDPEALGARNRARSYNARAQQLGDDAQLPKYIPSQGPNPFSPVVLPPTGDTAAQTAALPQSSAMASTPSPVASSTSSYRPTTAITPVEGSSRIPKVTTGGNATSTAPASVSKGDIKNDLPIAPKNSQKTVKPAAVQPAPQPAAPEQPGPGEISIWSSEKPAVTAPTPKPRANPDALRSQADALKAQGRYAEAATTYGKSIDAYTERIKDNPQLRAATQSSIKAVQAQKALCEQKH